MTGTTAYVVTVHAGWGSMVEAANARYGFGLFADPLRARNFADALYAKIKTVSTDHAAEWWCEVQAIHLPDAKPGKVWTGLSDTDANAEVDRIYAGVKADWDA